MSDKVTQFRKKGDPRIHVLLKKIGELHDRKQEDYGTEGDPFANIRASEKYGVPAWVGALVRMNDKVHRLQQYVKNGCLANEGARDSFMDIAVYALIAHVLYDEVSDAEPTKPTEPKHGGGVVIRGT